MGTRALVVTGASPDRAAPIIASLKASALRCLPFRAAGEPSVALVRSGAEFARGEGCDLVIAIGGGSAIDGGKAVAALLANGGDPLDYLEVIGKNQPLRLPPVPFIAVPTTAGTGTEVTRNAVLGSSRHRVKASLRSPLLLPRLAVVDPELTYDLPPALTARTGLDALTQLIEPFVSTRANAMTDLFCREGMRRAARSLARAYQDGGDKEAREDMAFASLLGGLSLANAGLGAVHGFAAPVGGMFPAPHGAVCAALLPHVMRANLRAPRYDEVARILTARGDASPEDGVEWVAALVKRLAIPPLAAYGVRLEDVPVLVEKASRASSMKANPIALSAGELTAILTAAIQG
jgi:alcohol dehydrogenase class IV